MNQRVGVQKLASPLKLRPFLPATKALQSKPANSSRLAFSLAKSVLPDPSQPDPFLGVSEIGVSDGGFMIYVS